MKIRDIADRARSFAALAAAALLLAGAFLLGSTAADAAGKPGGGAPKVSHIAPQTPPIKLGTSGGWGLDRTAFYCCGGTLGALVDVGGTKHILSNWHVFASDTVAGGNGRVAENGDPVIQPGLIDVECEAANALNVATLVLNEHASPASSNVDAAIAAVLPGMVSETGEILEVGVPSSVPVAAFLNQRVKKSGRTTRLSRSVVTDVSAFVTVAYDNECAGGPAFDKTFENQIIIRNRGNKFLAAGDSGSLLLEDVATSPGPVGLLYAGSSVVAVANPIAEVLDALGGAGSAQIVGSPAASGGTTAPAGLQAAVGRARAAQLRHRAALEGVPDSVGHAVGIGPNGRPVVKVLVAADSPRARAAAPRAIDGVPVVVEVVGRIVAY